MRIGPGGGDHQLPAAPQPLLQFDLGGQISQSAPVPAQCLQPIIEHDLILVEHTCEHQSSAPGFLLFRWVLNCSSSGGLIMVGKVCSHLN